MTGYDLTEAIAAMRPHMGCCVDCPHGHSGVDIEDAQALLEAVLPHLEQQIRESVAQDIEAMANPLATGFARKIMRHAALIARTRKDT